MGRIAILLILGCNSPAPEAKPKAADTPPPPPPASAPLAPVVSVREPPRLTVYADAGVTQAQTVNQQFAAQERDNAWAGPIETGLHKRLDTLHDIKVETAECHESLCKLVLVGTQDAIGHVIDAMGGAKGISDMASRWILSAPEKRGDELAMTAYVRFDRPTGDDSND